jgi:hypothetical protein
VLRLLASQNWTVVLPDPVTKFVPVTVPLKLCPAVGVLGLGVKLLTVGAPMPTVNGDGERALPPEVMTLTLHEPAPRFAFVIEMLVLLVVLTPAEGCV